MLSFHCFFAVISVTSGVWVFVIVYPFSSVPSPLAVYPSGSFTSFTVYIIFCPFSYTGKLVNVAVQLFSLTVCVFPVAVPFLYNSTVTLVGLFPSWLFLSFHVFVTVICVVSGVYEFVIVKLFPFALSVLVTAVSYPLMLVVSLTEYVTSFPSILVGKFSNSPDQLLFSVNMTVCPVDIPSLNNSTVTVPTLFPS